MPTQILRNPFIIIMAYDGNCPIRLFVVVHVGTQKVTVPVPVFSNVLVNTNKANPTLRLRPADQQSRPGIGDKTTFNSYPQGDSSQIFHASLTPGP